MGTDLLSSIFGRHVSKLPVLAQLQTAGSHLRFQRQGGEVLRPRLLPGPKHVATTVF